MLSVGNSRELSDLQLDWMFVAEFRYQMCPVAQFVRHRERGGSRIDFEDSKFECKPIAHQEVHAEDYIMGVVCPNIERM